jgi:hypothetical protein
VVAGAVGGVVGGTIIQLLIPRQSDFDIIPIFGQVIGAAASGAALTVVVGAVEPWVGTFRPARSVNDKAGVVEFFNSGW